MYFRKFDKFPKEGRCIESIEKSLTTREDVNETDQNYVVYYKLACSTCSTVFESEDSLGIHMRSKICRRSIPRIKSKSTLKLPTKKRKTKTKVQSKTKVYDDDDDDGEEWKSYNFSQLRRYAKELHLSTGSNPSILSLKDLISKALSNGPLKGSASWSEEERESAAKRKRALQSKTKIKATLKKVARTRSREEVAQQNSERPKRQRRQVTSFQATSADVELQKILLVSLNQNTNKNNNSFSSSSSSSLTSSSSNSIISNVTDKMLYDAIQNSSNGAEALRKVGLPNHGTNYARINRLKASKNADINGSSSSSNSSSSSGNSKQQQKKKVAAPPAKKKRKRSAGSTSRATPKKQSSFSAPIDALLQRAEQASKSKEYQEYVDNWNKQQAISNRAATSALQAVKPQQTSGIVAQSMLPPKLLAKNALKASTSNTSSPVASSSSSSPLSLSSSSSSSSSSSVALSSLVSIPMEVQTEFNPLVVVDGLGKKDSPALGETFLLWE